MTAGIERLAADHEFFKVGLELLSSKPNVFVADVLVPHAADQVTDERKASRSLAEWKRFFQGEVCHVYSDGMSVEGMTAIVWEILDEAVNRPSSVFARGRGPDGRWTVAGDRASLPNQCPVVVTDDHTCYGCGKTHVESIGWQLEIGPFSVPCCPGRGSSSLKRQCRFDAMHRLGACAVCGVRKYETEGGGRVCQECEKLVVEGKKARRSRGVMASVDVHDKRYGYEAGQALQAVLVSLGAVVGGADRRQVFVPALAVPEIEAFIETMGAVAEKKYQDGLKQGRDLLFGLAAGTVSVADFDAGGRPK